MSYLPITMPSFPNVPIMPGVPSLARLGTALGLGPLVALADAVGLGGFLQAVEWGLFDQGGNPILTGDCVAEVDYRHDYRVSDFPVEQGAFASYNKVQTPFIGRIVFMVGGNDAFFGAAVASRTAFLAQAEAMCSGLDLYSLVTPEVTYASVNCVSMDYRRTARDGVTLMRVEISVEEVRVAPAPQFTNSKTADGAVSQDQGVAPVTPVTSSPLPPPA
jgi:hypothetical protein